MACMSRKLWRSYSRPRLLEMRADIGTALTPALPIRGFSFLPSGRNRFITFTKQTPLIVAMAKAAAPMTKMKTVFSVRNSEACVEQPTVRPSSITTMSFRAAPAVLARRVVLPLSFSRLPKKSMPRRGRPLGTINVVSNSPMIGNRMRSVCDTLRPGFILMVRSFSVVSRRINGG